MERLSGWALGPTKIGLASGPWAQQGKAQRAGPTGKAAYRNYCVIFQSPDLCKFIVKLTLIVGGIYVNCLSLFARLCGVRRMSKRVHWGSIKNMSPES